VRQVGNQPGLFESNFCYPGLSCLFVEMN